MSHKVQHLFFLHFPWHIHTWKTFQIIFFVVISQGREGAEKKTTPNNFHMQIKNAKDTTGRRERTLEQSREIPPNQKSNGKTLPGKTPL